MVIGAGGPLSGRWCSPSAPPIAQGRTPTPACCEPGVKFRLLAQKADELGIPLYRHRHYARIRKPPPASTTSAAPPAPPATRAICSTAWARASWPGCAFRWAGLKKKDIRELARALGLPCADSPDSMEICFIPSRDYAAFIGQGMAGKPGRFIGPDGQDLGPHQGVLRYTLGQRKGLGIALGKPTAVKAIRENGDVVLGWAGEEFFSGMALQTSAPPPASPARRRISGKGAKRGRAGALPF